jgi:fatty-acyl-CoA synthase
VQRPGAAHPQNVRLSEEQLVYIANHAEDEVVFCDGSLLSALRPLVDDMKMVRHVIVMGSGPLPHDARDIDY